MLQFFYTPLAAYAAPFSFNFDSRFSNIRLIVGDQVFDNVPVLPRSLGYYFRVGDTWLVPFFYNQKNEIQIMDLLQRPGLKTISIHRKRIKDFNKNLEKSRFHPSIAVVTGLDGDGRLIGLARFSHFTNVFVVDARELKVNEQPFESRFEQTRSYFPRRNDFRSPKLDEFLGFRCADILGSLVRKLWR